jgi:hypothetical protein
MESQPSILRSPGFVKLVRSEVELYSHVELTLLEEQKSFGPLTSQEEKW